MSEEKKQAELFEIQFKEDLKNKQEEKERLVKSIKEHKEILEEMQEVANLWKEGIGVVTKYCRKVDPTFEYETKDEYWALQEKLLRLEYLRKYYTFTDQEIPHMEKTIKAKESALEELEKVIKLMEEK